MLARSKDIKEDSKAWLSDKPKTMPDIDLGIAEDSLTILISFLKTCLGNSEIKKLNSKSFRLGNNGPLVRFAQQAGIYYFKMDEKENKIPLPKIPALAADWGIDFEKTLPKSIIDVYSCLHIKQIEFWIQENLIVQMEFYTENIHIFGLKIELMELKFRADIAEEIRYVFKIKMKYYDLILEGDILNKEVLLKGHSDNPQNTFTNFVKELSGFVIPEWLNKNLKKISKIEGELNPFSKRFNFKIHIDEEINIFSIDNQLPIKLKELRCQFDNKHPENEKINIQIEGQLGIGDCEVKFLWKNNDKNSDIIQGEIKKEKINSLISFIQQKIGFKSDFLQFKSNLNYCLSSQKMEIYTENVIIAAIRLTGGWDFRVSFKGNLTQFGDELKKFMPDFIAEVISKTDLSLTYVNRSLIMSANIPVHEIKEIKQFLGNSKLYLPLEIKKQKDSWNCTIGDINLPEEINFLSLKLTKPKIKIQDSKLHLESGLNLGLMGELKGSLAIGKSSLTGSFGLKGDITILGIILKELEAAVSINPALSLTAKAQFEIAGENKEPMGPGSTELGVTAGCIKSLKMTFPPGFSANIKNIIYALIPLENRDPWKEKIDKLYEFFPVSIEPIKNENVKQAIRTSNDTKLIELFASIEDRLVFSADLLEPSLTIAGEINLGDTFSAFIISDINLRTGVTLFGGLKPIDLFGGRIKFKKSNYVSADHKSPIELAWPTIYARIPGWESLLNFNELSKFCLHSDACIEFFGFLFDSSINLNSEGFDLYLKSKLDCPIFISTGQIHIIGKKNEFLFSLDTKVTIHLSVINTTLVDVDCRINFSCQITEAGFIIQAQGSVQLNLLEIFNKTLAFSLMIANADSENLLTLVTAIPQSLAKMDINNLEETCPEKFHKKILMDQKSDEKFIDDFNTQYFNTEEIARIGLTKLKICLFRYLLRVNNPSQISEAFKLINEIEMIPGLEKIDTILQRAICALENKPALTFCYLRFTETHLLLNILNEVTLLQRGLAKYYLGVMYANQNVPMSMKFSNYSKSDQIIEDKNPRLTYLSSKALFRQAIHYFVSSYLDFDQNKKNNLLILLPLYQLWHCRDLLQSDEIEPLSLYLKKKNICGR